MKTKYLGTEITVDRGTSSSSEVAWVVLDGERICFLGGETEARAFLRDRKYGPWFGPRQASWQIKFENETGGSTITWSAERARETVEYFARQGRATIVTRTEFCPVPGCDGRGQIAVTGRRGMVSHRTCGAHEPEVETCEHPACGFGIAGGECYACELARDRCPICGLGGPK